ncbi:cdc42 effector protein 3 [Gadus morhua]|uniref:Zgc:154093 n=1 Tax=Gadus morhua TaxID=8049 RepID=A0A8C5BHM8_GADMO|nr:cdc42 effector protein 3-like [Gadus morhua]
MPAKTPMYLKTTTPKRGKKIRLRDVLSGDMISPPLGDVRHSAHVGPQGEGDMFGDVGFLQGKLDMLPAQGGRGSGGGGPGRSHSVERRLADGGPFPSDPNGPRAHDYSYNGFHYINSSAGLLKSTVSMPVFIAHEQAPPKPPRLHLEDSAPAQGNGHGPSPHSEDGGRRHAAPSNGHSSRGAQSQQQQQQQQQRPVPSLRDCGVGGRLVSEPCRDISFPAAMRKLVPSSGSFSEVSSEDSVSETCGPLGPHRGLSLDSDAGLSNEDLRSDRSESPGTPSAVASPSVAPSAVAPTSVAPSAVAPSVSTPIHPGGVASLRAAPPHLAISRSDSLAGLNLDLGPSILEDVLGIMERYKKVDERCEL